VELTEDTHYIARAHQLLAHIELDRGEAGEGLRLIRRSLQLLEETGNELERAKFRLEEARALIQLGEVEEAAQIALESAGQLREIHPLEAGRGYGLVAEAFEALGDGERAVELYELAAEVLESQPTRYLLTVYGRLAELLEQRGAKDEAFAVLKKAMGVQTRIGVSGR